MTSTQTDNALEELKKEIIRRWPLWGPIIIVLLTFLSVTWWFWDDIKQKPFVAPMLDSVDSIFHSYPNPIPGQFNVAIAKLENDESDSIRQELAKDLQNFASKFNELGTKETRSIGLALVPLRISLDNEIDRVAVQEGHRQAREFLFKHGYDVIIWGVASKKEEFLPSLFWTTLAHEDPYHNIDVRDEKLPTIAIRDLTTVLRALISAQSAIFTLDESKYLADRIRPFIDELRSLIETSGNKPGWNTKALWQIKIALADCLKILGQQADLKKELEEAIKYYEEFLLSPKSRDDLSEWARIQDNLGITVALIGTRNSAAGATYLQKAVKAHNAALSVLTKDKTPWDWARVQNNLGNTQLYLGKLNEAEIAFHSSLDVWTKDKYPLDWATVQNNLGNVLVLKGDNISLNAAIDAYHKALKIRTKDKFPLDFSATQDNLGSALSRLGQQKQDAVHLNAAVHAHKEALTVWIKDKNPWDWAVAKNNLGETLIRLSERESRLDYLNEANQVFLDALSVQTQDKFPSAWAATLNNLGVVLSKIGERQFSTIYLKQAIMAFSAAATVWSDEKTQIKGITPQDNLKKALKILSRIESTHDCINMAESAYYAVIPELLGTEEPEIWLDKLNKKMGSGSRNCKKHSRFVVMP